MGSWSFATVQYRCGADSGHEVARNNLVWSMGRILRCEQHAPGHATLTDQEADAVRHAHEAIVAQQGAQGPTIAAQRAAGFVHPAPRSLDRLLRDGFGIAGRKRRKP